MKILVTAFEEFGNVKGNSSLEVLKRLDIKDKIIYNSTLENAYAKILLSGK